MHAHASFLQHNMQNAPLNSTLPLCNFLYSQTIQPKHPAEVSGTAQDHARAEDSAAVRSAELLAR